jgi:hypothetical protein
MVCIHARWCNSGVLPIIKAALAFDCLSTPGLCARALLYGGDEVVQGEEQWQGGDRAELRSELNGLRAINEENDCGWLCREPGAGLGRSVRMAEQPGIKDQHLGERPWDRVSDQRNIGDHA